MSLPSSGPMSLSMIAQEFGGTPPHSLSQYYRGGGLVPNSPNNTSIPTSGPIGLSNFYSTSRRVYIPIVFSSTTLNVDLMNYVGSSYVAGISDIAVTINSGVVIGSSSISAYAMYIRNFSSGDTVTIYNNGYIVGKGGDAGIGTTRYGTGNLVGRVSGWDGGAGGPALYSRSNVAIINNGIIGGGGGAGGTRFLDATWYYYPSSLNETASGGGGAGYNYGQIVQSTPVGSSGTTQATLGSLLYGGTGGVVKDIGYVYGGPGGSLGYNGSDLYEYYGDAYVWGGAAGLAVDGNSYINWSNLGDVRGARIN